MTEERGFTMRNEAALNLIVFVMVAATLTACLGNEEAAAPYYAADLYGPEYASDAYYCPGCPGVIHHFYVAHAGHAHSGHGHGHGGHGGHH
jgi:hypothetical protein